MSENSVLARMQADVIKYEEEETMDKTQQMLQKIDRIAQLQLLTEGGVCY
eukprot:SAG22_NODE_8838_length_626_cov_3.094877_1_plen_50_part_00